MRTAVKLLLASVLFLGGCQKDFLEETSIQKNKSEAEARSSVETWPGVFNPGTVLSLHFQMTPEDWDIMRFDVSNSILVPARFKEENDANWIDIQVRRKSSRALPSEADPWKIGMKVSINRPNSSQRWRGLTQLSLENGSDVGPIAEGVAWNLYEMASEAGGFGGNVHAGLAAWVRVYVDIGTGPQYLGVYISVEQRNKQFLRNRGMWQDNNTWLYEVDDINSYVLDEGDGVSPILNSLCFSPFVTTSTKGGGKNGPAASTCATPADAQLKSVLDGLIDMRNMLVQGAIDAYTGNGDALFTHTKNFKVVDFATGWQGGRRLHYPWDLDAVFGPTDYPIYGKPGGRNKITQNEYQRIILNHPQYRQEYNQAILDLLNGPLHPDNLAGHFDSWKTAVMPALLADPYEDASGHIDFDGLKDWVRTRDAHMRAQVAANNNPVPRK
jgi:hypothetical protein